MRTIIISILCFAHIACFAQNKKQTTEYKYDIVTTMGTMKVLLYNETPLHRDNFVKLADSHFFDSILFHRVINGFMIQTGDPDSKNAPAGKALGMGGTGYVIPAEFNSKLIHKKGALAAARISDQAGPLKSSSGSQFYIAQGKVYNEAELKGLEQQTNGKLSPEQLKTYSTVGGIPFLDNSYTVFGEVIEGLDIIDKIAMVKVGDGDRPVEDVRIIFVKPSK